jgi:hypothetical protein
MLITNRHNVTGLNQQTDQPLSPTGGIPNEVVIRHNRQGILGHWIPAVEPLHENGSPLWLEHPRLGVKADFVALPLTHLLNVQLYPYTLNADGPAVLIWPAEVVSVVGFPYGLTAGGCIALWATGFVASIPTSTSMTYQSS